MPKSSTAVARAMREGTLNSPATRANAPARRRARAPASANGARSRSRKEGLIYRPFLVIPSEIGPRGRSAALRSSPAPRRNHLGADEQAGQDDRDEEHDIFRVDDAAGHVLEALGDADVLDHVPGGAAYNGVGEHVAEPTTK